MAAFPTNTLFVVHTGGNNVTATRPYAEATPAELDAIADGYDDLLAVMATRPGAACSPRSPTANTPIRH